MSIKSSDNYKITIGICAPVDAGKTTLSEQLLFLGNAISRVGRVDNMDSFLDTEQMERERGITIISKQACFTSEYEGKVLEYTLLDTPGHDDLTPETERVLSVLDMCILLISAADGIGYRDIALWRLLESYNVPVIIFVNKMDQINDEAIFKKEIFLSMHKDFSDGVLDIEDLYDEETCEYLSLIDDGLMDIWEEKGAFSYKDVSPYFRRRKVFPVIFGSALKGINMDMLLERLNSLAEPFPAKDELSATVFKTGRGKQGERLTFIKLKGGILRPRDEIETVKDGESEKEKINEIRIYSGEKYVRADTAVPGGIYALTGLNKTYTGQGIGAEKDLPANLVQPSLKWSIVANGEDPLKAFRLLKELEDEEPLLNISFNERTREITADITGEIQRDVIKRRAMDRLGLSIDYKLPRVIYKETIKGPVEGVGHFEPLRHYAEVHLLMEPLSRNSGLVFESRCPVDELAINWQRLVLTHLKEKRHKGVLTGSDITDIKITLVAGKAHLKHTEGGDFRQAVYRAVRQGLMTAENMLLEPYYDFSMELPNTYVGKIMTELENMGATFSLPEINGDISVIKGRAPVLAMVPFTADFRTFTKGQGHLFTMAAGYDVCHDAESVIKGSLYDPDEDIANPSSSVFCSHGSGDIIPWDRVQEYMAIPYKTDHHPAVRKAAYETDDAAEKRSAAPVTEEELIKIFEKTYGPIKTRLPEAQKRIYGGEEKEWVPKGKAKKEKSYLLVDGYNIIYAWDDLRKLADQDIKAARDRLVDILSNFAGYSKYHIVCVFDAYLVKESAERTFRQNNVDIVFTKQAETADLYIEKAAKDLSKNYYVTVATSDYVEQVIIYSAGAERFSARDLLQLIIETEQEIRENYISEAEPGRKGTSSTMEKALRDAGYLEEETE